MGQKKAKRRDKPGRMAKGELEGENKNRFGHRIARSSKAL